MDKDNSFKQFIETYKVPIIVGEVVIGSITLSTLLRKVYIKGARAGAIYGFQATIDWFDKNFDGLNLRALWEEWAKQNPDKIVYR